ncbi:NADP-dependent malic enzyme [Neoehrlichia mikurensis]|uniref:NADP-dependent malic enzyme n=1 Tax=Neoehrlichia mikurensis TaxID=89586 RepID=A0A9Q9BW12_9RICK|nr:NADP-dependent malic enzyme [Neoehrlichia mikurensis]QXK92224.1 NADP-dependent malic enzyme [Neoehrlichia mikurensis]QXK92679.1 NADP-dependent malic enzyme [Neoehrlichia mikurensis]QXK93917.1 NADP-dependent malic enzyme [Neoehrlichia mikurensis]UTO55081.1 NADP-dependent malic enzyme [Neoehrlichia mikurensis]UTO56000.1 NADP-dependent malic enzyme [Neoehrlichia mikurensis]
MEKDREALRFHCKYGKPGKVSLLPTKPLMTQRDLSLAYSPGVAVPCLEIASNPNLVYKYTAKGNYVAVISNGTAVLGLGNIGPLASKPVMEGKAVLFKRFADIDAIDIEVNTENVEEFINAVKYLGLSWGGINLEDIKAPECFIIEEQLNKCMDIPVFHDDQHGTAIIILAGIINALDITGKSFSNVKIVVNGAGAAGIACVEMLKRVGVSNIVLCDQNGVIYKDRQLGVNPWKMKHAIDTNDRTLKDALVGADIFIGLSVRDVLNREMLLSMNKDPVIFALANPDPEVKPEFAREVRPDAIIATGRSDYNNQVNNVMGFPYIFRGALDVHATSVNHEMKIAAANAIAMLAREIVSDEVSEAYGGRKMIYGKEYIIPTPFDPRLITIVSPAVAKAAVESGVAKKTIENWDEYTKELNCRVSSTANVLNLIYGSVRSNPKKVIFSEGEEDKVIKAALQWYSNGYGNPILVGRTDKVMRGLYNIGIEEKPEGIIIANAAVSARNDEYINYMYSRLQRYGYLYRSCIRDVKTNRNIFAACMLACNDGDALVTGITRSYTDSLCEVQKIISSQGVVFGLSIVMLKDRTIFIADTAINKCPTSEQLAVIAIKSAAKAKQMGHEPKVGFISFSNFGSHSQEESKRIKECMSIIDRNNVDFEYDGEMSVDVALNPKLLSLYPFCRLSGPANVLIMPNLNSASISSKLLQEAGNVSVIGPILIGMEKSVQIVQMSASVSEILNLAVLSTLADNY